MARTGAYTAEEFTAKMDAFIGYCKEGCIDATDYQLIEYFGIPIEMLEKYRTFYNLNDNSIEKMEGYSTALIKLDLYREDATIRQIVTEPKLTSHGALKLKQPHWGGWGDKQEPSRKINIRVKISDDDRELLD